MAKPIIMNMAFPTGYDSCPKCYIVGENFNDKVIFKFENELRSRKASDLKIVLETKMRLNRTIFHGIKGKPQIDVLRPFYDSIKSTTIDFMHSVDLGVNKRLIHNLLDSSNFRKQFYFDKNKRKILDDAIKQVKCPNNLTGKVRPFSKSSSFKASEWNAHLIYFMPVFLEGQHKKLINFD